jgi:probable F420-dependent oxidoreductase
MRKIAMRMGMLLRNSGPVANADFIAGCARAGDAAGLDDLWVLDHVAIPPDDAEGSGGRYVDALATLAYVAGVTTRVGLGTSVLVVPYRAALPTAKWLAAIQELSHGRLSVGVGAGWMAAEFKAAGVSHSERGRITDDTLAFIHKCFANDIVSSHGLDFIFSPRPTTPPILVGGHGSRALQRVLAYGDGWMPTIGDPEKLREPIAKLRTDMQQAGKAAPTVIPLTSLDLSDTARAGDQISALAAVGCSGVEHAERYDSVDGFKRIAERLLEARRLAKLD